MLRHVSSVHQASINYMYSHITLTGQFEFVEIFKIIRTVNVADSENSQPTLQNLISEYLLWQIKHPTMLEELIRDAAP